MPFFLPSALIDLEYLRGDDTDTPYSEEAKSYQKEIDFAFFVANFGYSKTDYEAITPREKAFIYKAWENKIISDSYALYNAVFKAVYNVNRPKRKQALKLWKKASQKKANMEVIKDNLKIVREVDQKEGSEWVKKIYQANHMTFKGGENNR